MVTIANGEWIADLGNLTCRNINTQMVAEFEKCGRTFRGKMRDMLIEVMSQRAALENKDGLVRWVYYNSTRYNIF